MNTYSGRYEMYCIYVHMLMTNDIILIHSVPTVPIGFTRSSLTNQQQLCMFIR